MCIVGLSLFTACRALLNTRSEESPGIIVSAAIIDKKSHVSPWVKRSSLRREAKALQLLWIQGHPASQCFLYINICRNFEYTAIGRLGQTLGDIWKSGQALKIGTVACIAEQLVFWVNLAFTRSLKIFVRYPPWILTRMASISFIVILNQEIVLYIYYLLRNLATSLQTKLVNQWRRV